MDNENKIRESLEKLLGTSSREVIDVDKENEEVTLEITVRKNQGEPDEMIDTIKVTEPYTLEGLKAEYGEAQIVKSALRPILSDKATHHRKNRMITEAERQEKIQKDKQKVAQKVEDLKAAGLSEDDIRELLG